MKSDSQFELPPPMPHTDSELNCAVGAAQLQLGLVFCGRVNVNKISKHRLRLDEAMRNPLAHKPSDLAGTDALGFRDLKSGNGRLARQYLVNSPEPTLKRIIAILKDSSGQMREPIAAKQAIRAFPCKLCSP